MMGLGVLTLFAFSPTFLAHGRLVTTDVGAAFGAVIAVYYWLEFLKHPTKGSIVGAAIAFGIAMLLKFTLVLLIPFFGLITIFYALLSGSPQKVKNMGKYILFSFGILIIAFLFIIWPLYQFHILHYPQEHQLRDTIADLSP